MYKWPQGKFIRMSLLVLTLVATGDLGWQSYASIASYLDSLGSESVAWQAAVQGGVLGIMALVTVIGGVLCVAFLPKTVDWLIEVEHEMMKVTWPGQSEIVRSTIAISIMTVILALLILAVDSVNYQFVVKWILQRGA